MKANYKPKIPPTKPVTLRYDQLFLAEMKRREREIAINSIAIALWTAHSRYGWGATRLRRMFEDFSDEFKKMCEYYEMGIGEYQKLCTYKLKEQVGIDVVKWSEEFV